MRYCEAMDSQLEKRSVNVLEKRWTAAVDRENVCILIWNNGKKKEMCESKETGTCASGKLLEPGLWAGSSWCHFSISRMELLAEIQLVFTVWQEDIETKFRKQNMAPHWYFVKSMLDFNALTRVKVVSSHFDIKQHVNIKMETVGILRKI